MHKSAHFLGKSFGFDLIPAQSHVCSTRRAANRNIHIHFHRNLPIDFWNLGSYLLLVEKRGKLRRGRGVDKIITNVAVGSTDIDSDRVAPCCVWERVGVGVWELWEQTDVTSVGVVIWEPERAFDGTNTICSVSPEMWLLTDRQRDTSWSTVCMTYRTKHIEFWHSGGRARHRAVTTFPAASSLQG